MRRAALSCGVLLALAALSPAAQAGTTPTFSNYVGPTAMVGDAGEPSIGYNPKTDATFFQAYTTTARAPGFDGLGGPPWTDLPQPAATTSLDPILWTDRGTGRTITSQLLLACSQA